MDVYAAFIASFSDKAPDIKIDLIQGFVSQEAISAMSTTSPSSVATTPGTHPSRVSETVNRRTIVKTIASDMASAHAAGVVVLSKPQLLHLQDLAHSVSIFSCNKSLNRVLFFYQQMLTIKKLLHVVACCISFSGDRV